MRRVVSRKKYGSSKFDPYTSVDVLSTTLRTELPSAAGRREQVHGADHVDLVQSTAARARGVDLEVGVQHGVDLRGPHHALQDARTTASAFTNSVRSSGSRGSSLVDAHHELDRRDRCSSALRDAAPPERAETGDEDAHGPAQPAPDAAPVAQQVVDLGLDRATRIRSASSITTPRL